jgi:hypothetical protein
LGAALVVGRGDLTPTPQIERFLIVGPDSAPVTRLIEKAEESSVIELRRFFKYIVFIGFFHINHDALSSHNV